MLLTAVEMPSQLWTQTSTKLAGLNPAWLLLLDLSRQAHRVGSCPELSCSTLRSGQVSSEEKTFHMHALISILHHSHRLLRLWGCMTPEPHSCLQSQTTPGLSFLAVLCSQSPSLI